jgi:hypothetical protein
VYVSFDDGAHWQVFEPSERDAFTNWLPIAPIYDLIIKDNDLLVATHGRAFWILDDISPLRQMAQGIGDDQAHLFQPCPAKRVKVYGRLGDPSPDCVSYGRAGGMTVSSRQRQKPIGEVDIQFLDAGKNPPDGAIIDYWLKGEPKNVTLTIKDSSGNTLRRFSSTSSTPAQEAESGESGEGAEGMEASDTVVEPDVATESVTLTAKPGGNRFIWNLRVASAKGIEGANISPDILLGPVVVPGPYKVELNVDGKTYERDLEVQADRVSPDRRRICRRTTICSSRSATRSPTRTTPSRRSTRSAIR